MKSLLRHERVTQLYSVIKSLYKSNFVPTYTKDRPDNHVLSDMTELSIWSNQIMLTVYVATTRCCLCKHWIGTVRRRVKTGGKKALYTCDPLPQNQEQVLFDINWVIGFIRRARRSALIWYQNHFCFHHISGDMTICDPNHSNFLQKCIVRKWQSKFTFYININGKKT